MSHPSGVPHPSERFLPHLREQVVKESYHALPGLAIPDVLRVVDDVVVVGSTAAAHAPIRTFKLGPPLVPLRTLLLSSEGGVRLRGLSIQVCMRDVKKRTLARTSFGLPA